MYLINHPIASLSDKGLFFHFYFIYSHLHLSKGLLFLPGSHNFLQAQKRAYKYNSQSPIFHPSMSDTEKPVAEKKVEEKVEEKVEDSKPVEKKASEDVEKAEEKTEGSEKKRATDGEDKLKKRRKRRQYDDLPKEEPESEDGEDDTKDDNRLEQEWDDDEEEDMLEIDESNIITGRRTRGKVIDFKKAAEELKKENKEVNSEDEEDYDEQAPKE